MSDSFDPYRKWLGILPSEQPPEHYRLLGIARFEDDLDTISNGADRQMAHVRTFQTGRHSVLSQKLLNEIPAARICLLDAAKKAEYDRQLRATEANREQPPAAPAPLPLTLRPIDRTPPTTPAPRTAPPVGAWPQPVTAAPPRVPVPQTRLAETLLTPVDPAPLDVGPSARCPPQQIIFRKPRREPSERYKTLLIAAGLAAFAVSAFVVYKTRSRANAKVTPDEIALANQLVDDDADKARQIGESRESSHSHDVVTGTAMTAIDDSLCHENPTSDGLPAPQPPPQMAVEPSAGLASIWEKLTQQLNDLNSWKATSGDWSEKDGRLYGQGDCRLTFQKELPETFLLSFEMTVVDGLRPRIFIGDGNLHFGNEGYERTLFVYDNLIEPVMGAPRPYATGVPLKIACRIGEQEFEFLVDGKLVARCGRERSRPVQLTLSAGDWWSKGQVLFGRFTLGPAPTKPIAPLLPETSSGSIEKRAPAPATSRPAANDASWRELFDGKSLAGWTGDVGLMRVQNGVLVNHGKRAIVTAPGDYQDFELEIEFRLAKGGNSGLGICYSGSGDPSQNGLEVQMLDDGTQPRPQDHQRCGALYGLAAAKPGYFKRWPEWNELRVTSLNDIVRVQLNGTLVTDTTRSLMKQANPKHPGVSRTSGKVCLFPIEGRSEYRRIRIRPAK